MTSQGIEELEIVAGGCLKAIWAAEPNAVRYNIYVRPDNSDIFHEEYILGRFSNPRTGFNYDGNPILFVRFRTEANGNTLLQHTKMYYVGVRPETEEGLEDPNDVYLFVRPLGTGECYTFVNDRHVSIVS